MIPEHDVSVWLHGAVDHPDDVGADPVLQLVVDLYLQPLVILEAASDQVGEVEAALPGVRGHLALQPREDDLGVGVADGLDRDGGQVLRPVLLVQPAQHSDTCPSY